LETSAVYRGTFPNQQLNVPINILGGVAPFALNVNWGDDTNQVLPSSTNTTVNAMHTYKKPGTYKISIQGSDSQQRVAFLDVAAIVNGQPAAATSTTGSISSSSNKLLVLWPLYAISVTLVVSFYLGERREKHILADALRPAPTLRPSTHAMH
ncbi:MAG: PKD domain-containing protein, partial [Candidatus Saccharimonadales bacterium]